MADKNSVIPLERIESKVLVIRDCEVLMDQVKNIKDKVDNKLRNPKIGFPHK